MTEDQIAQLAKLSEGMAHILRTMDEIKTTMQNLHRDFVSRPHYEGEITALKLRIDTLSETVKALQQDAKKSPFDSLVRFFSGVSVVLAGVIALYVIAQWVVRHA